MATSPQQYVILPTRGIRFSAATSAKPLGTFLTRLNEVRTLGAAKTFVASEKMAGPKPQFRVVDSIHEDGAKLVEMTAEAAAALRANQPGVRIVPVVYFRPMFQRRKIEGKVAAAATSAKTVVTVLSAADDSPVAGATVVAFSDFKNRVGAQGKTTAQGVVKLNLGKAKKIEQLYVYSPAGFWGAFKKNVAVKAALSIPVSPIDFAEPDVLRHYYGTSDLTDGTGVKVGVVDTGVGPHPHLTVTGGENTVEGEDPGEFEDNGATHGTHVAGIIAARGSAPNGLRGVAPGVTLFSYRVFPKDSEQASNFAIAKAIDRAVAAGCDLINLSLGGGPPDPTTSSAIHDARQAGTLVIAAAGNDDRSPVSFPAADPLCLAVSAMGRIGTFPKGSVEEADVEDPFGTDEDEFVASFSNIGDEISVTGTGVGVVSTIPTDGYAIMSGTSMACPAVTGFAARLLGGMPNLLKLPRNQDRSDQMAKALLLAAKLRGFGPTFEGSGLPGG
jgi:subtilisin